MLIKPYVIDFFPKEQFLREEKLVNWLMKINRNNMVTWHENKMFQIRMTVPHLLWLHGHPSCCRFWHQKWQCTCAWRRPHIDFTTQHQHRFVTKNVGQIQFSEYIASEHFVIQGGIWLAIFVFPAVPNIDWSLQHSSFRERIVHLWTPCIFFLRKNTVSGQVETPPFMMTKCVCWKYKMGEMCWDICIGCHHWGRHFRSFSYCFRGC